MVQVQLPKQIELKCPECSLVVLIPSRQLSGRSLLTCSFCAQAFNVYDALEGPLRRQIYYAIRDELEQRIYEQKRIELPGYFEDTANVEDSQGT